MKIKFRCEICSKELSVDVDDEKLKMSKVTRVSLLHGGNPHTVIIYLNREGKILSKEYIKGAFYKGRKDSGNYGAKKNAIIMEHLRNVIYNKLSPILAFLITGYEVVLRNVGHRKSKILELIDYFTPYPLYINDKGDEIHIRMDTELKRKKIIEYRWTDGKISNSKIGLNNFRNILTKYRNVSDLRFFLSKISKAYRELKEKKGVNIFTRRKVLKKVVKNFNIDKEEGQALKELLKI